MQAAPREPVQGGDLFGCPRWSRPCCIPVMLERLLVSIALTGMLAACSSDPPANTGSTSDPIDEGSTVNGLACDASIDGTSQCGDDTTLVFCSEGEWWGIDCTTEGAQACIDDGTLVDCVITSS